jgi:hypothetical protein
VIKKERTRAFNFVFIATLPSEKTGDDVETDSEDERETKGEKACAKAKVGASTETGAREVSQADEHGFQTSTTDKPLARPTSTGTQGETCIPGPRRFLPAGGSECEIAQVSPSYVTSATMRRKYRRKGCTYKKREWSSR